MITFNQGSMYVNGCILLFHDFNEVSFGEFCLSQSKKHPLVNYLCTNWVSFLAGAFLLKAIFHIDIMFIIFYKTPSLSRVSKPYNRRIAQLPG